LPQAAPQHEARRRRQASVGVQKLSPTSKNPSQRFWPKIPAPSPPSSDLRPMAKPQDDRRSPKSARAGPAFPTSDAAGIAAQCAILALDRRVSPQAFPARTMVWLAWCLPAWNRLSDLTSHR
jgi:hypothetical protein